MADLIRIERPFLSMFTFAGVKPFIRRKLLEELTNKQIRVFAQLAYNSLHNVIPLTRKQKRVLAQLKNPLIKVLASKRLSLKKKKEILVKYNKQAFDFISQLYPTIQRLIWRIK